MIQIDQYGFVASSQWFHKRALEPYKILKEGDVRWICFRETSPQPIHRIEKTSTGEIQVTWAFGAWEDRKRLDYIAINETRMINV